MQRLRVTFKNQADGKDYVCGLKVEPSADLLRNGVSELVPGAEKAAYEKKKAIDGAFLLMSRTEQLKWLSAKTKIEAKSKAKIEAEKAKIEAESKANLEDMANKGKQNG